MSTRQTDTGFILTRNSIDNDDGSEIHLWLTTNDGPVLLRIKGEFPLFFIATKHKKIFQNKYLKKFSIHFNPLDIKTFSNQKTTAVYCKNLQQCYRVQKYLKNHNAKTYEADIRLHDRYLMERFIHSGVEVNGECIRHNHYREYRAVKVRATNYHPNLNIVSLDIECSEKEELYCIGLSGCDVDRVLMIGEKQPSKDIDIQWHTNEHALLQAFIQHIKRMDPDVIIGWNVINFDLRILFQRARYYGLKFSIGRGQQLSYWKKLRNENEAGFFCLPGRVVIDGISALKTATYSFSSFSLENVAQKLLGTGKTIQALSTDKIKKITGNFLYNKQVLATCNLQDCKLVTRIFEKTNLIDFMILRSQLTGLELGRSSGSVAAFTHLYFPRLHRSGYVAPNLTTAEQGSPGGYVMNSKPGIYKSILVLDFKSLYPSIIRTFKIDPVGLIEGLKNPKDTIKGFRGGLFHRSKHHLPEIIADFWHQRDIAKQNNDKARSQALKILMNSFYGVLGSSNCHFFDSRLASSITMRGHEIMQTTTQWIEKLGYEVIYGDTDSIFVSIHSSTSIKSDTEIGDYLETLINTKWKEKLRKEFDIECFLEIEFETCFGRFHMPTIRGSDVGTKKRYAGMISSHSPSGKVGEIIFKGLENVRTDWTDLAKIFQFCLYQLIFNDQDPTSYIQNIVNDTLTGKYKNQLIYRKQLQQRLEQYVKNIPPHVKAARLSDQLNLKNGKPLCYQNKSWISYFITINGPQSIEYLTDPIDYQHYIDKQLKPVADAILPALNLNFNQIISPQTLLF